MAFSYTSLLLTVKALSISRGCGVTSSKVLSLGYPDMLLDANMLSASLGPDLAGQMRIHPQSAQIIARHHLQGQLQHVYDAKQLFGLLGFDLEVLDIEKVNGDEIMVDLNDPCPEALHQKYALVIDGGTLEHCFNIAQAAKNVAEMVALNGCLIMGHPLNWYNHGFYNLNPTWYHDFLTTNGFEVDFMSMIHGPTMAPVIDKVPKVKRFDHAPDKSTLLVMARKTSTVPIKWPIQTKYKSGMTTKAT